MSRRAKFLGSSRSMTCSAPKSPSPKTASDAGRDALIQSADPTRHVGRWNSIPGGPIWSLARRHGGLEPPFLTSAACATPTDDQGQCRRRKTQSARLI